MSSTPLSNSIPDDLRRILELSFVLRTTMTRRKSGGSRTIETTYTWDEAEDGSIRVYLSGYPGRRDWVANMGANPTVVVTTVEGETNYVIPAQARVLRERNERVEHLLAFIDRWAERPDFPRKRFRFVLASIRLNRRLRLPWWGPFYLARWLRNAAELQGTVLTTKAALRVFPDGGADSAPIGVIPAMTSKSIAIFRAELNG